jgi:hypothetical protein
MSFKCTEAETIWPPEDMAQTLRADANAAGCGISEFMRDMICMHQHGVTFGEYVANHRRAALQNKAASAAQLRGANSQAQAV